MEEHVPIFLYYVTIVNIVTLIVIMVAAIESLLRYRKIAEMVLALEETNPQKFSVFEAVLSKRRIVFVIISLFLLIWIAQRFSIFFMWIVYTYYTPLSEKLLPVLWADGLRAFSVPIIIAFVLLGISIVLYILYSTWQEHIYRRLFWRCISKIQ